MGMPSPTKDVSLSKWCDRFFKPQVQDFFMSYKLFSRILSKLLSRLLGTLLRSVQSCSKPGANICSSTVNHISTVEGVARQFEGEGAILSLDIFKAYDSINLSYMQSVMEAMNIPDVCIYWIMMLHHGANSRLLLDLISEPIDLTFSVRQGDPIAIRRFLLYVKPLLLCREELTMGV